MMGTEGVRRRNVHCDGVYNDLGEVWERQDDVLYIVVMGAAELVVGWG